MFQSTLDLVRDAHYHLWKKIIPVTVVGGF